MLSASNVRPGSSTLGERPSYIGALYNQIETNINLKVGNDLVYEDNIKSLSRYVGDCCLGPAVSVRNPCWYARVCVYGTRNLEELVVFGTCFRWKKGC